MRGELERTSAWLWPRPRVLERLARVGEDVGRLSLSKDEMAQRLVGMRGELGRVQAENSRINMVAKEIETMQRELQKGRFEKKAHGENEEQSKQMENNMISMACDIEKLRSELANTQQRAQAIIAAASPGTLSISSQ